MPHLPFIAIISSGAGHPGQLFRQVDGRPQLFAETQRYWVLDLDGLAIPGRIPVLIDHDRNQEIGAVERIEARMGRLLALGWIDPDRQPARTLLDSYRLGARWRPSVGVPVAGIQTEILDRGVALVNGRDMLAPAEIFRAWTISEVSLTENPADEDCSIIFGATLDSELSWEKNQEPNESFLRDLFFVS